MSEERNSDKLYNMEEILLNKEKFAKLFSEGNENLEKCLLTLWNNNINTLACCIGHYDEIEKISTLPYISIIIENETKDLLTDIMFDLVNFDPSIGTTLEKNSDNILVYAIRNSDIFSFSTKFFNSLLYILNKRGLE